MTARADSMTATCALCGLVITEGPPDIALFRNIPADQLQKTQELAMFDKFAARFSQHVSEKHAEQQQQMMGYMGLIGKLYAMTYATSIDADFVETRRTWNAELFRAIKLQIAPDVQDVPGAGVPFTTAGGVPLAAASSASSFPVSNSKKSFRKTSN